MKEITKRQAEVLEIIRKSIADSGEAPTMAEIASKLGLPCRASAHFHVQALEKKGFVKRTPGAVRGIEVL